MASAAILFYKTPTDKMKFIIFFIKFHMVFFTDMLLMSLKHCFGVLSYQFFIVLFSIKNFCYHSFYYYLFSVFFDVLRIRWGLLVQKSEFFMSKEG